MLFVCCDEAIPRVSVRDGGDGALKRWWILQACAAHVHAVWYVNGATGTAGNRRREASDTIGAHPLQGPGVAQRAKSRQPHA